MALPVHPGWPVYVVESVTDGDTLIAMVYLGLGTYHREHFRLTIIDTPEKTKPGWLEARLFAVDWVLARHGDRHSPIPATAPLNIRPVLTRQGFERDTLGRVVADVWQPTTGESLSSALLQAGHAVVWK